MKQSKSSNMTDIDLDIIQKIRNTTCVICGHRFSLARAGKLYCSAKCKQFSFYHKAQIQILKQATAGINDTIIRVSLRQYQYYNKLLKRAFEYKQLTSRRDSKFATFTDQNQEKLNILERLLPTYLKCDKLVHLSLEEWSFFKVLYPNLPSQEFIKLVNSFERAFIQRLRGDSEFVRTKGDPLSSQYQNHLKKIAEGKILFI